MRWTEKIQKYVIIVHFRNPYFYNGGSENIIISQNEILEEKDIKPIIIFPINKPIIPGMKFFAWNIICDREYVGAYTKAGICKIVNELNRNGSCLGVFIHSFIFADLKELAEILSFRKQICVYLHDYYTCCEQYTLMKNDIAYCGNALLNREKCFDCVYYSKASKNKEKFEEFFDKFEKITFVAPSQSIASNWGEAYEKYKHQIVIISHNALIGKFEENVKHIQREDKIRLAFVGKGIRIKGYEEWKFAVEKLLKEQDKYIIYHFGNNPEPIRGVESVSVQMFREGRDAMIKKLRSNNIDIAVLFSKCPETYSLTYFECFASNIFIVGNANGGNIPVEINKRGNGVVLNDSCEALYMYLSDIEKVRSDINAFRKTGICGPMKIEVNKDFMHLVGDSNNEIIVCNGLSRNLNSVITELLYRIRYRES